MQNGTELREALSAETEIQQDEAEIVPILGVGGAQCDSSGKRITRGLERAAALLNRPDQIP